MKTRAILAWSLLLCPSIAAGDGIELLLDKGPAVNETTLTWSGKLPPYDVHVSVDAVSLIGLANRIHETSATQWTHQDPAALLFYSVKSRPPMLDDLVAAANDVAGHMETYRTLPGTVQFGGQTINSAEFLHLATRSVLALTSTDPFPSSSLPPGLMPPIDPYPAIGLDDAFYREPFTRNEYLDFFRQIDDTYIATGTYPATLTVAGTAADMRYCEMVYDAAGLLRARQMFGDLPRIWNHHIISPRGLVPWNTPTGFEEYTSALELIGAGIPFFANAPRRYYGSSAHEYPMFKLATSIYGSTVDPYTAGESLFDWVVNQWLNVVGYTSGRTQFRSDHAAWQGAHFYYHTSGGPRVITSGLHRTAGIPASRSGAAYFDGSGWVNIDQHRAYGTDPLNNPFYYDPVPPRTLNHPEPDPADDFVQRIVELSAHAPIAPHTQEQRTVYVNASDVLDYGADYILDRSGAFDAIVLTVKTTQGGLFYGSTGWPERERGDALLPLLSAAHTRGKKVYAGFATLADRDTSQAQPTWRQQLNESGAYPNLLISPCVQDYQNTLISLLQNLIANYDIDGVALSSLYYGQEFSGTDTVGHPDCPTGTNWMPGVLTDYATDLVDVINVADPTLETVILSYPLGYQNTWGDLSSGTTGHQDLAALSGIADHVALVAVGTYWLPQADPWWVSAVSEYQTLTGSDPWISLMLTSEWEYGPLFYRGVMNEAREAGVSGINFHTTLSVMGELSPAFTRPQWKTLGEMPRP